MNLRQHKSISIIIETAWFYYAFRESFERTLPNFAKNRETDGEGADGKLAEARRVGCACRAL